MTERQSVTYCEIDIDVCSHQFGKGGCYGQLGYEGGGAPNAVAFDGVATYLTRGGGLTGAGDAKTGTVSVWIRRKNLGGRILAASTTRIIIAGGTAKFELIGANAGGSTILNLRTLSDIPDDGKYHHILASFDLSNPARRHVYLDDEPDLDVLTWIDDVVDFTLADWGVAATSTGTSKLEGGLAELWFQPGLYLDLSDEENRRKFITADLRPVDLGPSGDAPTGSAPLVYLGGAPESWHINLGTGGGFTVHGSPEDDTFSTGDEKCFNSPGSCQAKAAFDKSTVTLRFAKATDRRPAGIEAIPVLTDVRYEPAVAAPGVDLGTAPRITFRFITTPHADAGPGFDPYRSERAYNPYEQGDLWAKFRARQPFLKGAPIRWIQGFVSDELADMETRHFVVEDFNGPDADGVFTITGSSPLRKLFGQTAAAPAPTTASLLGSITSGDSTAVLTPLGSGSQYAASGHVAIGSNEIAAFTRSGDTLTLTQRGALGTTAAAHESGERIQQCLVYEPQDVALIIYDLIVNQAGLPAEWCDLAAWQVETTTFLARLYSARLPDPTSINKLLVELIQQCGLFIWWDELGKQVRLQVLRPIDTDSVVYDESVYLADSFEPEEQLATRKSQVWVKYAQANPLRGEDDDNFDAFALFVPPEFTPGGDEDVGERSIEHVKSRWIVLGAQATAQRMAELLLSRYLRPPRRMRLRLFRHSHERPEVGQGCLIKHRMLQDPSGAPVLVPAQIISVRPDETGYDVIALEMDFVLLSLASAGLHDLVLAGIQNRSINIRTMHDSIYPAAVAGDVVNIYLLQDAIVGSNSVSTPALQIGSWPTQAQSGTRSNGSPTITGLADTSKFEAGMAVWGAGIPNHARIVSKTSSSITIDKNATSNGTSTVTVGLVRIKLHLRNLIGGRGGNGGRGANGHGDVPGTAGQNGGTALYTRYPIDIDATLGTPKLWGGGGGGGGAGTPAGSGGLGPDQGEEGKSGTQTTGGAGGRSYTSTAFWVGPSYNNHNAKGGNGGNLGQGASGVQTTWQVPGGAAGTAGRSIDGVSWVKITGTVDIRGPQAN